MDTQSNFTKWWALIGVSLLSFTGFLDYTIVATALPFIQKELNASVLELQWVMNIFGMILCMFLIAAGQAGDLFGRKRVFFLGFALFAGGALGAGGSPSIEWLIFFRALQGFAVAIIFTIGVALLPQAFPEEEQAKAIGVYSAFNGAGLAIGPFLGGVLISFLSWRWVFWINIPIIIIGILMCAFTLKPSPKPEEKVKFDWTGLFLLMVGLGSLVYGIISGEQYGWNLTLTWASILVGIIGLFFLIIYENKTIHPLLDLSLFKEVNPILAALICWSAGILTFIFLFFDPLYLGLMRNLTAFWVGSFLLCMPVVQVIISLFFEKLLHLFGVSRLIIFALAAAVITAILHLFFTPTITILFVLFTFALMGYSWGIANVGSIAAITSSIPAEKTGKAIGTVFTFWNLSGSIALALGSVIFHWRESASIHSLLYKEALVLTPEQHQQIHYLLSDPEHARDTLTQVFGANATEIYSNFMTSFMNGFYWVSGFSAISLFILFLIGLLVTRRRP
ncbi:multidrug efflux system protein [Legionella lansingensis]|uniref:Multidrug efflux system protein n=1 Tax=Legionella lansingensis TaxID=45067 RepID=A0A0W0VF85_9GAMM|nr:MFS transporter [Legionella lansingensis]KTD18557.1 multidrug efflux system protein [Legionella lansingensis]SNV51231.1 multidrug efflux system protein [Legionella lansingensis]